MFLGTTFAGSSESLSTIGYNNDSITSIELSNCIADELYATKDVLTNFNWNIPETWAMNTYLHAKFEETLHAGNVEYSTEIVNKVKIKKRFVGDFEWKTIYEQEVNTNEDFAIEYYDYYEPTGREIEYAYVFEVGTSDVESAVGTVESQFYNYFICGQNGESYPMIVNMDNIPTYNRQSQIILSPGRKYPYVVNNGITQYYSGNITVSFIRVDEVCDLDGENAWKYRNEIDKFLANGEPKILKSFEGDMWMIHVINNLPRSSGGHYQLVNHQIEWVETGDPYLIGDLYDNNFINTDVDRE